MKTRCALVLPQAKIIFTQRAEDPYIGDSADWKSWILRFCLLEKRTQCRKLESCNKLLLIDYLQLRIGILQLRGRSGVNVKWGEQNLNGRAGHHLTPAGDGHASHIGYALQEFAFASARWRPCAAVSSSSFFYMVASFGKVSKAAHCLVSAW